MAAKLSLSNFELCLFHGETNGTNFFHWFYLELVPFLTSLPPLLACVMQPTEDERALSAASTSADFQLSGDNASM